MKTSKPKKTKKPIKVAVFYPTNGLTKEEINRRMLQKYSGKSGVKVSARPDGKVQRKIARKKISNFCSKVSSTNF